MRQAAARAAVVAVDLGTTGVRAFLIADDGAVVAQAYREALPTHPGPGLVEHDLEALFAATLDVVQRVLQSARRGLDVRALGVCTQRSSAGVWDAANGRAPHAALSWQDGRTVERCNQLLSQGVLVVSLTAASKLEWLLDRVDPDRTASESGRLRFGTLDTWLAWRLTGGGVFVSDASNASCNGLWDPASYEWSTPVLDALRIPQSGLPAVVDSGGVLGRLDPRLGLPPLPLASLVGDQQAAMMGQLRLAPGEMKITYGTAAMLDVNAGTTYPWGSRGTYPLVLWQRDGVITFCLEGTAITAGAAVTWLRDGLGVIQSPAESGTLAASVPDSGGAWAVPAFQGLGTPYMEPDARAIIGGLSRGTTRAHVVRAVLEGIAWRCREAYDALRDGCPHRAPATMRVDGGAAANDVLLQAQADALGLPVERAAMLDAAALGTAYLAGLATGVWTSPNELDHVWRRERLFEPTLGSDERETRFAAWRRHVPAARP
jgi:glycerol kinase